MLNTNAPVVHFYSAAWLNIPPPLTTMNMTTENANALTTSNTMGASRTNMRSKLSMPDATTREINDLPSVLCQPLCYTDSMRTGSEGMRISGAGGL